MTNIIGYINALTGGIFNQLVSMAPSEKQQLANGTKTSMAIGDDANKPFAGLGIHKDGFDWLSYDEEHRKYFNRFINSATPEEIKGFEIQAMQYLDQQLDAVGFHYGNQTTVTFMFRQLQGVMSAVSFAVQIRQTFDWNNVDQFVLEATLTKVVATHTFISQFLNDKIDKETQ
jgi:hypothetical protein